MERVLIVDDNAELRSILCDVLRLEGYDVCEAVDGIDALEVFARTDPDAVLLDVQMPRQGGLETLKVIRGRTVLVPVIILTGNGDIPTAVEAVKRGAFDFIQKHQLDFDRVLVSLRQALDRSRLEREMQRLQTELQTSLAGTFGPSADTRGMIERIRQVAATELSVILQGETGTGKSYVARTIHQIGARSGKPFVRVDLSVIPETLIESELFGSRRGAYTGADRNREGYFAAANGGTLFLDEAENIPTHIQAKLLDVIETGRICPLGGGQSRELDLRVIVATNCEMGKCVESGAFRRDLFYRLGEFVITIPPLRERPEDVRFFMDRFLLDACAEFGRQVRGFSDAAAALLLGHSWPGNVRELKNVVRRAVLLAVGDMIERGHIDLLSAAAVTSAGAAAFKPMREVVHEVEHRLIRQALSQTAGNRTQAAELLQISYPTFLSKIREYGIS